SQIKQDPPKTTQQRPADLHHHAGDLQRQIQQRATKRSNQTRSPIVFNLLFDLPRTISVFERGRGLLRSARRPVHEFLRQCLDRKSTRLNSSDVKISYAVFCLKKKKLSR